MMNHYVYLGPVPSQESAAQLGVDPDFARKNEIECRTFQRMLRRHFPVPDGVAARFTVKSSEHDFGTYREVVLLVDLNDPRAMQFADDVQRACPCTWDERAQAELAWFEESYRYRQLVNEGRITLAQVPRIFLAVLPPEQLPPPAVIYAMRPLPASDAA